MYVCVRGHKHTHTNTHTTYIHLNRYQLYVQTALNDIARCLVADLMQLKRENSLGNTKFQ